MASQRYLYIDRLKGFAILLVVIGHVVARDMPPGSGGDWYIFLKDRIYAFHMPLFMWISGLVYGLTWKPEANIDADIKAAGRKVKRLLPAYLVFGLAIFMGKILVQNLVGTVDNPVNDYADVLKLIYSPGTSFSSFLWYIYALSLLYTAFPLAYRFFRGNWLAILGMSIIFWFLPSGTLMGWDRLQNLTVFFVLGVISGGRHQEFIALISKIWVGCLICFLVLMPLAAHESQEIRWLLAGLSICAFSGLFLKTEGINISVLEKLGAYTLIIYLTNVLFIGVSKVFFVKMGLWIGSNLLLLSIIMTVTATGGAILLKKRVLKHIPPLDKITT